MPWLSIVITLLTFFLAGGSKPENRGKAAALGLAAGAATYGITHYTDWGRDALGNWDGLEIEVDSGGNPVSATKPDGTNIKPVVSTPTTSGSTGFWGDIGKFFASGTGQIATGVAAGAALAGIPTWALLLGGGVLLYAIFS